MLDKYIKFVASRAVGTGVDTLVLWLCSHFLFGGGYLSTYIISPFISFEMATMSNFLWSYYWIWNSRIDRKTGPTFWRHFIGFNISAGVGFVVKMAFLLLFERIFGWNVVVCNLVALTISGTLNFALAESLVFRKPSPTPEHPLLTLDELATLSPLFRGRVGRTFGRFVMWALGINRANQVYNNIHHLRGASAARAILDQIGCDYLVGNPERLDALPQGAFITISTHTYGGLDGIITVDMLGSRRSDLKVMVNQLLARIEPLADNFITVTPTGNTKNSADATTLHGLRTLLAHLREGHPVSLFPSGAVSDLHLWRGEISDREWQEGLIRLIQRVGLPIVPIHFTGRNSLLFYTLGLIDWRIRLLRLPREIFNKHKGLHRVVIGEVITPAQQQACATTEELTRLLRSAVYNMPTPADFTPASELHKGCKSALAVVELSKINGYKCER